MYHVTELLINLYELVLSENKNILLKKKFDGRQPGLFVQKSALSRGNQTTFLLTTLF